MPKLAQEASFVGKFANGWAFEGIGVYQSGQPFSVIDYGGAGLRLHAQICAYWSGWRKWTGAEGTVLYDSYSAIGRAEWRDSVE